MQSRRKARTLKGFVYGGKVKSMSKSRSRGASRGKTMKSFVYGGRTRTRSRTMRSFVY